MEIQPKFIRDFSKEESQEERDKTAKEIREKRNENKELQSASFEHNCALGEQLEHIEKLKNTISDLSENGVSKLMNYFKLKELRAKLVDENSSHDQAKKEEVVSPDMEQPKRMLDAFYADQKKKWKDAPYSKEDIEKNFSEEHLASLSIKDYALLMRRFPQEMVTHVTRQGIRDHTGMNEHNAGEGEFQNGFEKITNEGKLKSILSITLTAKEKDEAMAQFLKLDKISEVYGKDGRKMAMERLATFTREDQQNHQEGIGEYVDRRAIHFAIEQVADFYYGAETGNEIFFAFPSAQIASQYYFDGQLKDMEDHGGNRNDRWVWSKEEKGIDINSGLVFIPESAMVDPETGSRYKIDKEGNPEIDGFMFNEILRVIEADGFQEFSEEMLPTVGRNDNYDGEQKKVLFRERLLNDYGITEPRLQNIFLNYHFLQEIKTYYPQYKQSGKESDDGKSFVAYVKTQLERQGIYYREAEKTILSQEYWDNYFAQNPDKKPNKIVYYNGSPTGALRAWKENNGLKKEAQDEYLGFNERKIQRNEAPATDGIDRFKEIAERVINTYYDEHEVVNVNAENLVEKVKIVEVTTDRNFEGSIIVKTEDGEGRLTGYAIRRNNGGDLEGNEIVYMEDGSTGPVYQLHEADFKILAQQGIMESYENYLAME